MKVVRVADKELVCGAELLVELGIEPGPVGAVSRDGDEILPGPARLDEARLIRAMPGVLIEEIAGHRVEQRDRNAVVGERIPHPASIDLPRGERVEDRVSESAEAEVAVQHRLRRHLCDLGLRSLFVVPVPAEQEEGAVPPVVDPRQDYRAALGGR